MKWWGWGAEGTRYPLPESARRHLVEVLELGPMEPWRPDLGAIRMPETRLSEADALALGGDLGEDGLRQDSGDRVLHAVGRSYRDVVRLRRGRLPLAPDAIVYPANAQELRRVLERCASRGWAVVPFGGGTSVVGGVEPRPGAVERPVVTVDLARLDRAIAVDPASRTATFEAGIKGPALEAQLARYGLSLGHFPQSFEFSTLGGWVATRSAGQASTGNGRIEDMVVGLVMDAPSTEIRAGGFPGTAAGPDLASLLVGSEGCLGIIREVTVRVRELPRSTPAHAFLFRNFSQGWQAMRDIAARPHRPTIIRLSDEAETELFLHLSPPSSSRSRLAQALGSSYAAARGFPLPGSCLMLFTFEGEESETKVGMASTRALLRRHGGLDLGASPARKWRQDRFHHPYLRDELLDMGALVDTLETCAPWGRLGDLYGEVQEALRTSLAETGSESRVLCHVSHIYEDGASLYFTFFGRQDSGDPEGQWDVVKRAASDAIARAGGTITHHHAVGYEHRPWLEQEITPAGLRLLRHCADDFDPTGIMNPDKMLG